MKKVRLSGLDLIRFFAFISVIVLHYTEYFYVNYPPGAKYLILHMIRWTSFSCIGLFIMCTGFLQYKKEFSLKYYKNMIPIIITFAIYSVMTAIIIGPKFFPNIYNYNFIHYAYFLFSNYFFQYKAYNWYMSFYFSLYLLIPFINNIIKNFNKSEFVFFLIIIFILESIPGTINQINDFFPLIKDINITVPSSFSSSLSPFTYYFLGAFFSKFNIKLGHKNKLLSILLLLLSLFIHSFIDQLYLMCNLGKFDIGSHIYSFDQYGAIFTIISCVIIFLLLYDLKFTGFFNKIISLLGSISLELYLSLAISDAITTDYICKIFGPVTFSIGGFVLWTLSELISSVLIGLIMYIIINCLRNLIKKTSDN